MKINCLNAGYVELLEHMGGDKAIIDAARVCYQSHGNDEADKKLIKMLIKEDHRSPLEHCVFRFMVKAPIFVVRQWQRHRTCSYCEKSLRYCDASPEFYIPDNIQEDYLQERWLSMMEADFNEYLFFQEFIPREQARSLLPLGIYTEFIWTVNGSSLCNFLGLRLNKHAQAEIREYAAALLDITKTVAPITFGEISKKISGDSNG